MGSEMCIRDRDQATPTVVVPTGFITDFASIPRIFWQLLPSDGIYTYPAVIHDYLYWSQHTERKTADKIFRYAMQDFNVDDSTVTAIYTAVRLGGGLAWRSNANLKQKGEKRILTKYPDDPRILWSDWKKRKDVF